MIIRDDEFLDQIQGVWSEWPNALEGWGIIINGNTMSCRRKPEEVTTFHLVSTDEEPEKIYFELEKRMAVLGLYETIELRPDMILIKMVQMQVFDAYPPSDVVYARKENFDNIKVPDSAKHAACPVMGPEAVEYVNTNLQMNQFMGQAGMGMMKD